MPQTAKPSAKTTPNATSGPTMPRRDLSTGATVLCTLTVEGPPARNATLQERMNVPNNHHTRHYSNLWCRELMDHQDQVAQNATASLVVTHLILMNVMMVPLAVLITFHLDISVMKKIFKSLKELAVRLTVKLCARTTMSANFSPIGMRKDLNTGVSATFTEIAMRSMMKSAGSGINASVDPPIQTWMTVAILNNFRINV